MVGFRLPKNVVPSHYNLSLTPIPAKRDELGFELFEGQVDIDVTVVEATDRFLLHAKGLGIGQTTFTVGNQVFDGKARLIAEKDFLEIIFAEKILANTQGVLTISFDGPITLSSAGIYQNSYQGGKRRGIATQFEQAHCRQCFPCWDEPGFKATFALTIVVPSFYTVLFNSPLMTAVEVAEGLTKHTFGKSPHMSTYLVAIFVGEADVISAKSKKGVDVRVWTPVGETDLGQFALENAVKGLNFLEEFYDYHYVMPKIDLIGLDSFVYGGMENWGLITFTSTVFYFRPESASPRLLTTAVYIIGHELAHMWFGNLVTMRWWNDLWLNEGFATYAGWLVVKHIHPEWDVDQVLFDREQMRCLEADSHKTTHAVEFDESIDDPDVLTTMVDTITYSKGFCALRMAAEFCGEENFTNGVRAYIKKFAYKNTVTSDLFDQLSLASGKDVTAMVGKWTSLVGYPVIHASRVDDRLVVSQKRFLSNGESVPLDKPWPIPLRISWGGESSAEFLFDTENASFELPLAALKAPFLLIDPGHSTLLAVVYSAGMWQDLLSHGTELASVDRVGLLYSRISLSGAGYIPAADVVKVLNVFLVHETDPNVIKSWSDMLQEHFASTWSYARGGKVTKSLVNEFWLGFYSHCLKIVGDAPKAGELGVAVELRSKALSFILAQPQPHPLKQQYLDMLPSWKTLSSSTLITVVRVALSDSRFGFNAVKPILSEAPPSILQAVIVVLASSAAVPWEEKLALIESLPSGQVFQFFCALPSQSAWEHFRQQGRFEAIADKMSYQGNPVTRAFASMFSSLSDPEIPGQIDQTLSHLSPKLQNMLQKEVEKLKQLVTARSIYVENNYEQIVALLSGGKQAGSRGRASSLPMDEKRSGTAQTLIKVAETVAAVGLLVGACYGAYLIYKAVSSPAHQEE